MKFRWLSPQIFTLPSYNTYQGFSDSSVGKESAYNAGDPSSVSWVGKIHWRRDRLPTPVFLEFPCGSAGKESACNMGDLGSIPGLGRSPGEGNGYPLQYSGLENSMDCIVHGVSKSLTRLSSFHFHFLLMQHIRINVRQSIDVNMKSEPIKLLEENMMSS